MRLWIHSTCVILWLALTTSSMAQIGQSWVSRYNWTADRDDVAFAVTVDAAGNVYVTGQSVWHWWLGGTDYATVKYDPAGNELWSRRYSGTVNARFNNAWNIDVDGAGNVYVTGTSLGDNTGLDIATIKYDTDGVELWVRRYNGAENGDEWAGGQALDGTGNVYVTGRTWGGASGNDVITVKYAPDGTVLWERIYDGPAGRGDAGWGLTVDVAGNICVVGEARAPNRDVLVLKYDPAGNLLWDSIFNGPGNRIDFGQDIAADALGNLYVVGVSHGGGTDFDYVTLKFAPDGTPLWERRFDGPASGIDFGRRIVLDGAGNVVVSGSSWDPVTNQDGAIVKYDADGNLMWERRFTGAGGSTDDIALGLGADALGNVYLTGAVDLGGPGHNLAAWKYDAAGNLVWLVLYDGPAGGRDVGFRLALGGGGTVYVTGFSEGFGTDFVTIKFEPVPVVVLPKSFTILRGLLLSGGLPDLFFSDDSRLVVRTAVFAPSVEPPVQIEVVGTSPTESPSELRFRFEGMASRDLIQRRISLYNYVTQSYEELHVAFAATSDEVVEIVVTSNVSRFVEPGTRQVKSLMTWKAAAFSFFTGWNVGIDQTIWKITP
ncbi:MAG: SBBP repeat-containing protein [Armatimonadetes bacterium]|nr:SBBP repeat-containing protein [Armatimonadota bacterium]